MDAVLGDVRLRALAGQDEDRVDPGVHAAGDVRIDAVFLLSGEGVMADIEKYSVHPSYVFQNIRAFLTELEKGEAV